MSLAYDEYLKTHIKNVIIGYEYLREKMPKRFEFEKKLGDKWSIEKHDESKYSEEEYMAYDKWFYGSKSFANKVEFNKAWLHHIHENPHHWQHWLLIEDDPDRAMTEPNFDGNLVSFEAIEMPDNYIMEMIADWWSFSWKTGNLLEVFEWYKMHEKTIKMHPKTRLKVEEILGELKAILGKELSSYILDEK